MLSSIALVLSFASLAATPAADAERPASKQDVQELKAEVQELRLLMVRLLEIEDQRLSNIRAVLNDVKGRGLASRTTPPPEKEASHETKVEKTNQTTTPPRGGRTSDLGAIAGHVAVTGGTGSPLIYVYVEDVAGKLVKNKTIEVKQLDKQFVPSTLVVQRGTKVVFPNLDKISHNVFSLTPGSQFDLGTYQSGEKPGQFTFTQPGPVEVFCNLHSQMSASILVVPNGHYTKVGPDGRFTLKDVPSGKHKLVVWTPNAPPISESVTVAGGQESSVELSVQASASPPKHTDKNGMPYGSYQ